MTPVTPPPQPIPPLTAETLLQKFQLLRQRTTIDPFFAQMLKLYPPTMMVLPIVDKDGNETPGQQPFTGTHEEFDYLFHCLQEKIMSNQIISVMESQISTLKELLDREQHMHLGTIAELEKSNPETSMAHEKFRLRGAIQTGHLQEIKNENHQLKCQIAQLTAELQCSQANVCEWMAYQRQKEQQMEIEHSQSLLKESQTFRENHQKLMDAFGKSMEKFQEACHEKDVKIGELEGLMKNVLDGNPVFEELIQSLQEEKSKLSSELLGITDNYNILEFELMNAKFEVSKMEQQITDLTEHIHYLSQDLTEAECYQQFLEDISEKDYKKKLEKLEAEHAETVKKLMNKTDNLELTQVLNETYNDIRVVGKIQEKFDDMEESTKKRVAEKLNNFIPTYCNNPTKTDCNEQIAANDEKIVKKIQQKFVDMEESTKKRVVEKLNNLIHHNELIASNDDKIMKKIQQKFDVMEESTKERVVEKLNTFIPNYCNGPTKVNSNEQIALNDAKIVKKIQEKFVDMEQNTKEIVVEKLNNLLMPSYSNEQIALNDAKILKKIQEKSVDMEKSTKERLDEKLNRLNHYNELMASSDDKVVMIIQVLFDTMEENTKKILIEKMGLHIPKHGDRITKADTRKGLLDALNGPDPEVLFRVLEEFFDPKNLRDLKAPEVANEPTYLRNLQTPDVAKDLKDLQLESDYSDDDDDVDEDDEMDSEDQYSEDSSESDDSESDNKDEIIAELRELLEERDQKIKYQDMLISKLKEDCQETMKKSGNQLKEKFHSELCLQLEIHKMLDEFAANRQAQESFNEIEIQKVEDVKEEGEGPKSEDVVSWGSVHESDLEEVEEGEEADESI